MTTTVRGRAGHYPFIRISGDVTGHVDGPEASLISFSDGTVLASGADSDKKWHMVALRKGELFQTVSRDPICPDVSVARFASGITWWKTTAIPKDQDDD